MVAPLAGGGLLGQLPGEGTTPGSVFDNVGVDYAGLVYIRYGFICMPTVVRAYICHSSLTGLGSKNRGIHRIAQTFHHSLQKAIDDLE